MNNHITYTTPFNFIIELDLILENPFFIYPIKNDKLVFRKELTAWINKNISEEFNSLVNRKLFKNRNNTYTKKEFLDEIRVLYIKYFDDIKWMIIEVYFDNIKYMKAQKKLQEIIDIQDTQNFSFIKNNILTLPASILTLPFIDDLKINFLEIYQDDKVYWDDDYGVNDLIVKGKKWNNRFKLFSDNNFIKVSPYQRKHKYFTTKVDFKLLF